MIDEIFQLLMKEARARPGKDLVKNIYTVHIDLKAKINSALEALNEVKRRKSDNEE